MKRNFFLSNLVTIPTKSKLTFGEEWAYASTWLSLDPRRVLGTFMSIADTQLPLRGTPRQVELNKEQETLNTAVKECIKSMLHCKEGEKTLLFTLKDNWELRTTELVTSLYDSYTNYLITAIEPRKSFVQFVKSVHPNRFGYLFMEGAAKEDKSTIDLKLLQEELWKLIINYFENLNRKIAYYL